MVDQLATSFTHLRVSSAPTPLTTSTPTMQLECQPFKQNLTMGSSESSINPSPGNPPAEIPLPDALPDKQDPVFLDQKNHHCSSTDDNRSVEYALISSIESNIAQDTNDPPMIIRNLTEKPFDDVLQAVHNDPSTRTDWEICVSRKRPTKAEGPKKVRRSRENNHLDIKRKARSINLSGDSRNVIGKGDSNVHAFKPLSTKLPHRLTGQQNSPPRPCLNTRKNNRKVKAPPNSRDSKPQSTPGQQNPIRSSLHSLTPNLSCSNCHKVLPDPIIVEEEWSSTSDDDYAQIANMSKSTLPENKSFHAMSLTEIATPRPISEPGSPLFRPESEITNAFWSTFRPRCIIPDTISTRMLGIFTPTAAILGCSLTADSGAVDGFIRGLGAVVGGICYYGAVAVAGLVVMWALCCYFLIYCFGIEAEDSCVFGLSGHIVDAFLYHGVFLP